MFTESLVPPEGYSLDYAIGTTFSLDLISMMTVPLSFTPFDASGASDPLKTNPLELLDALRRNSEKIALFCQAGRIAVPKRHHALFGYLEQSIFQVATPAGEFHPKLWVLRYLSGEEPVIYRVVVMSRNLTPDPSWDTMLVMDGQLTGRTRAYAGNHPLGDFLAALPSLADRPLTSRAETAIGLMQSEIRRVYFDPAPFDSIKFWPLGIRRRTAWPFDARIDRLMVISPFVTDQCLTRLADKGQGHILISRPESLGELRPETLKRFEKLYVLSDMASPEPEDEPPEDPDAELEEGLGAEQTLRGLHAKVYVADAGRTCHVWLGSPNATNAAFRRNVEFMVQLTGGKSRHGVQASLDSGDKSITFLDLLEEYNPTISDPPDPTQQRLEALLNQARQTLSLAKLTLRVVPGDEADSFNLQLLGLTPRDFIASKGVRMRCRPISVREALAKNVDYESVDDEKLQVPLEFRDLSLESITSFVGFEATAEANGAAATIGFVLHLPLDGAPEGRMEQILRSQIQNRDQALRYLMLLLSGSGITRGWPEIARGSANFSESDGGWTSAGLPLFETMLRALHSNPETVDYVSKYVNDLQQTSEGCRLLPEGFNDVWKAIDAARRGMTP